MCKLQTLFRSAIVILSWNSFSAVATVYQSDGSAASVQGLHDQVLDGDTITLPAGTFTWTSRLTITKAITLQGAGVGSTIIKDNVQGTQLILWTLAAATSPVINRLTGIEFQDGGRTTAAVPPVGVIKFERLANVQADFRWDSCKWNQLNGYPVFDSVVGVVDHNDFQVGNNVNGIFEIEGRHWNGDAAGYGDVSWSIPANFGSSQFLFIEDNTHTNTASGQGGYTDADGGARFVIRYNTIHDSVVQDHGTESTGRVRGGRCFEIYNNNFVGRSNNKYLAASRSGSYLFHHNNISGYGGWTGLLECSLTVLRMLHSFAAWGGADGINPVDTNTTVGGPFTVTAVAGQTVTVSGSPWTTNQFAQNATIRKTGGNPGEAGRFAVIDSNTTNTITFETDGFGGQNLSFVVGDTFSIYRVTKAIDQAGLGAGSLITGGDPPTLPPGWNDQAIEPSYEWGNIINGNPQGAQTLFNRNQYYPIKQGTHYFDNVAMPGYTTYTYPHPLVSGGQPSPTPTPTSTPAPTPTATATAPSTATPNPTPTPSPSATLPPSPSPSPTATPISPSPTPTATATTTATPTATPRHTPRPHPSHAPGP